MTGVLPDTAIRNMTATGQIASETPVTSEQIQPASLDLRLGNVAYRVRASFLAPGGATVAERLGAFTMHQIDLTNGADGGDAGYSLLMRTLAFSFLLAAPALASDRPMRAVVILADDLGVDRVGCYGAEDARTPHIDQLAARGTASVTVDHRSWPASDTTRAS